MQEVRIVFTSILYLSIPLYLFLLGHIRWYISFPLCLVITNEFFYFYKNLKNLPNLSSKLFKFNSKYLLALSIIIIWVLLSGTGGLLYQNSDYVKHNSILNDLINWPWPVTYNIGQPGHTEDLGSLKLIYYTGHYLPAAIIGKLINFKAAEIFQIFWNIIGVSLAIGLFSKLVDKFSLKNILFFIFFSGLDTFGKIILSGQFIGGSEHIEWWSKIWQYSSNTSLLFWVPQHALSGWILSGLLFYIFQRPQLNRFLLSILSLSFVWSPFILIGLLPYAFLYLKKWTQFLQVINPKNFLIFLSTGLIFGHYFLMRPPESQNYWIWNKINLFHLWPNLLLFYFLEFGLLGLLIYPFIKQQKDFLPLFKLAIIMLTLLPFYFFGTANDIVMRASIPSLFFLQICTMRCLNNLYKEHLIIIKNFIFILLFFGALTAITEMMRPFTHYPTTRQNYSSTINLRPSSAIQYLGFMKGKIDNYIFKSSSSEIKVPKKLINYKEFKDYFEKNLNKF